jgi:hypothetical protein
LSSHLTPHVLDLSLTLSSPIPGCRLIVYLAHVDVHDPLEFSPTHKESITHSLHSLALSLCRFHVLLDDLHILLAWLQPGQEDEGALEL